MARDIEPRDPPSEGTMLRIVSAGVGLLGLAYVLGIMAAWCPRRAGQTAPR
jgi:hypothetical protein